MISKEYVRKIRHEVLDSTGFEKKRKMGVTVYIGGAVGQAVIRRLPTTEAGVRAQVRSCGICGGQIVNGTVFSKYFGFPCHSFHRLLQTHHHSSSGAGSVG
jgi:hypothetical protein